MAALFVAGLAAGCGSSSHPVHAVTHATRATAATAATAATGAVYTDCTSATFLALDFLHKAPRDVNPADINNVTRHGERLAATALDQGTTRIDAIAASKRRTSQDTLLERKLHNATILLDALAHRVSHRTTPFPTTEVGDLSAVTAQIEGICPQSG